MAVSPQFQISARAETSYVIATKFQPSGRAEISARAETRHVIGPLAKTLKIGQRKKKKKVSLTFSIFKAMT